jgi:hypothetical protein
MEFVKYQKLRVHELCNEIQGKKWEKGKSRHRYKRKIDGRIEKHREDFVIKMTDWLEISVDDDRRNVA